MFEQRYPRFTSASSHRSGVSPIVKYLLSGVHEAKGEPLSPHPNPDRLALPRTPVRGTSSSPFTEASSANDSFFVWSLQCARRRLSALPQGLHMSHDVVCNTHDNNKRFADSPARNSWPPG